MFVQLQKEFMGRKAGERIDVSDNDGNLLIKDGVATAVTDDIITPAVQKAMEQAFGGFQKGLDAVIQTALKQFADAQSKSRRSAVPAIFGAGGDGDPKKTFGSFLLAVAQRDQKTLETLGSHFNGWSGKAALNEQTGAQGGYTVPTQFHEELFGLIKDMSIVESRATQVPATSAVVEIPVLDITQTPTAGETAYFGGVQANWEEEASTTGEEEPTFKQLRLQPRELKGYTLCSNSLLNDSAIGLEALLKSLFAGAVSWHEDRAFLRGTGANQPLGIITSGALISVTRSAASACALADVAGMLGRLLPGGPARSIAWVAHPTVLVKLLSMQATTVGGGNVFLGAQVQGEPNWQLLGYPVLVTDKVPSLNTAGDIGIYDFSKYVVSRRQGLEIAYSEHYAFRTNQGAWRFVSRVDGQPWVRSTVTLSDASSTLSPFVTLAAG